MAYTIKTQKTHLGGTAGQWLRCAVIRITQTGDAVIRAAYAGVSAEAIQTLEGDLVLRTNQDRVIRLSVGPHAAQRLQELEDERAHRQVAELRAVDVRDGTSYAEHLIGRQS